MGFLKRLFSGLTDISPKTRIKQMLDADYNESQAMLRRLKEDNKQKEAVANALLHRVRKRDFSKQECSLLVSVLGVQALRERVSDEELVQVLMHGNSYMTDTDTVKKGLRLLAPPRMIELLTAGVCSGEIDEFSLDVVCDVIEEVGTPDVVEPLVEMLFSEPEDARSPRETVIAGVPLTLGAGFKVPGFDEVHTKFDKIARLLLKLCGIEALRSRFTPQQFEYIVKASVRDGYDENAAILAVYEDLRSPWCLQRLTHNILNLRDVEAMKQSLVRIGVDAHRHLLETLEITWDQYDHMIIEMKRHVIEVLAQTGDRSCVSGLQSAARLHSELRKDVDLAIQNIEKRME